jgi:CTP:molybdopterin cytidylyltransferase MocA
VTVAAVVLAAGGGSRFAGAEHKLRTEFRGRPLVSWALAAAVDATLDEVVVVTGAVDLTGVVPAGVTVLTNPAWREGIATSLAVAVAHADRRGHQAIVVGLGDQPGIDAGAWRAVARAHTAPIVVATYDGKRRNPVRLAREVWPLLPARGDEGARVVMQERPELVAEVACPGSSVDVDTVEDLAQWS